MTKYNVDIITKILMLNKNIDVVKCKNKEELSWCEGYLQCIKDSIGVIESLEYE